MYISLFPEKGNLYKVNMHCHTTISDGHTTPEEVKQKYVEAGYSAVCFTDHEVMISHKDLCDENFIALHGYEVSISDTSRTYPHSVYKPVYHVNFISKNQDNLIMPKFFKNNTTKFGNARDWANSVGQYDENDTIDHTEYDVEWLNGYFKAVSEAGFLINYNHPQWSLQTREDYIGLEHIHSVEVVNGTVALLNNDNTSIHYEQFLRAGKKVVPTGGDDNHSFGNMFWGWTVIKAEELTYDSLIAAYERGDCYATEGPDIYSVAIEDGKVKVRTSPVRAIVVMSETKYSQKVVSRTETYTEAQFDYIPEKMGGFFRIELRDAEGYKAYSNAFYVEDIEKELLAEGGTQEN